MNPRFEQWKNRLKGQKIDLMEWADIFLYEYGMSFEEFKKLKIPTFWMLIEKRNKRILEQNKIQKELGKKKK